jgi:hypothetical protein
MFRSEIAKLDAVGVERAIKNYRARVANWRRIGWEEEWAYSLAAHLADAETVRRLEARAAEIKMMEAV